MWVRRSQERCQELLKPADQNVGLAASFGQFLDLQILGRDLAAKKTDFAFETRDIAVVGRGKPRRVGTCRSYNGGVLATVDAVTSVAAGRDWSGLVVLASSAIWAM